MDLTNPAPLSLLTFTINLLIGLVLSLLLALYYRNWGESLSNRAKFAPILPILALITLVVISIVKSSLALSLGLVGALSIVRFRTAIKDPEELVFLFFAIAIGLGMGADQRIPTIVAFFIIISYLFIRRLRRKRIFPYREKNLYLNIVSPPANEPDVHLEGINQILKETVPDVDLRRFDVNDQETNLVYYLKADEPAAIGALMKNIRAQYKGSSVSLLETDNLLGD